MGYTTEFIGKLKLNKVLDKSTILEIEKLNEYNPYEKGKADPDKPRSLCKWVVHNDKKHLLWNEQEKFYYYVEWLDYIINKILKPKKYVLSGELIAEGEDSENDISQIFVKNNKITLKIFTKKEIAEYSQKQEEGAEKEVGEIICKTRSDCRPLYKSIFVSLYELLFKGIFSKSFFHNLLLVREKDRSINLYDISVDESKKSEIKSHTLISHRKHGLHFPISKISEIIHYNSPLHKLIFQSDKVYCICRTDGDWPRKELYLLEDDQIISKIQEFMPSNNAGFLYYKSNDLYLIYFLFKRFIGALIIGYLTYGAIIWVYFSIMDLLKTFSVPLLATIGFVVLVYYFLVVKVFFKLFYYLVPKAVFRTKTVSNSVGN